MLTAAERSNRYRAYQSTFRHRSKNLRHLIDSCGSWHIASSRTGKSIQLLKQVAGDNPCRTIGDTLARELEAAFRLESGRLSAQW